MQLVSLPGVDIADLEAEIGSASFDRGLRYARNNRVVAMQWDDTQNVLFGQVIGSGQNLYQTTASFIPAAGKPELVLGGSSCSCPIGMDCKHVAALVLRAAADEFTGHHPPRPRPASRTRPAKSAAWEKSLTSLLEPGTRSTDGDPTTSPLAIELHLPAPAPPHPVGAVPGRRARIQSAGPTGQTRPERLGRRQPNLGDAEYPVLLPRAPR